MPKQRERKTRVTFWRKRMRKSVMVGARGRREKRRVISGQMGRAGAVWSSENKEMPNLRLEFVVFSASEYAIFSWVELFHGNEPWNLGARRQRNKVSWGGNDTRSHVRCVIGSKLPSTHMCRIYVKNSNVTVTFLIAAMGCGPGIKESGALQVGQCEFDSFNMFVKLVSI